MRFLRDSDYRRMSWRNGGGSTIEIAIHPETTGLVDGGFLWRASIADVAADGPFSPFPGYERHIMIISGAGMVLDAAENGTVDLSRPLVPRSFSGDWTVRGRLVAGAVRDFNLICRRDAVSGRLDVKELAAPASYESLDGWCLVHVLSGCLRADGEVMSKSDTLWLESHESAKLAPVGGEALLAVCAISR